MNLSPLGKNEKAFAVIAYVMVVAVAYGLTRVLSGRAAYIHVGAMFGTIMAANVWMRILPAQQKMIEAIKEGRKPDDALSALRQSFVQNKTPSWPCRSVPHDQQPLSRRRLRRTVQLGDPCGAGFARLGCREVHSKSLVGQNRLRQRAAYSSSWPALPA